MLASVSQSPNDVQSNSLFSLPAKRLDSFIEQVAADECQTPGIPYLRAINSTAKVAIIFKPRCKLWSCPQCAAVNQALWIWRATAGSKELAQSGRVDFITLTSHEKLDAAGSIAVLPHAWPQLRKRAQRASERLEYLIIPEGHKNGRVHLHALTTAGLTKRWWKDNARACGMGYQSDLQEVKQIGSVAGYVGKYLTKSLQFPNFARGFHRVRTSQGWPKLPELEQSEDWTIEKLDRDKPLSVEYQDWQRRGFTVIRADGKTAWEYVNKNPHALAGCADSDARLPCTPD